MNPLNIYLSLIIAIAILCGGCDRNASLTVHLRCGKNVSGTLQTKVVFPDTKPDNLKSFDIISSCKTGEIRLDNYQREKNVEFTLKHAEVRSIEIVSEYGRDIQSDQNGYYMVLKIENLPPFMSNDKI